MLFMEEFSAEANLGKSRMYNSAQKKCTELMSHQFLHTAGAVPKSSVDDKKVKTRS
jgi:hypothetical protein